MAVIELGHVPEVALYVNRGAVMNEGFDVGTADPDAGADWLSTWVAEDITGWPARLQVRADEDSEAILSLSTEDGTILNGGATGRFLLAATPTLTRTAPVGEYRWAFEFDRDGDPELTERPCEGPAFVTAEIVQ